MAEVTYLPPLDGGWLGGVSSLGFPLPLRPRGWGVVCQRYPQDAGMVVWPEQPGWSGERLWGCDLVDGGLLADRP